MVLSTSEVRAFYDRFGKKQDTQGFYENPALDDLIVHGNFSEAEKVFEFGCGTGRFAALLLEKYLPPSATYVGFDLSPTMIGLATKRLVPYADRVQVILSDGAIKFSLPDNSADRVVSTYVLDLLSEEDIRSFFREAHRVLIPDGKLGLISLTRGKTLLSRLVTFLWTALYRWRASLVGGCRPISLEDHDLDPNDWEPEYQKVVISFGVPSEVSILTKKPS
ncbi:MAG: class I SAM-dependent methyltransferase [Deltaproteobacteria bacterium]